MGLSWLGDYMYGVGQGIYDWMMGDDSGGKYDQNMYGSMRAELLEGIDRNNNVLRDSFGEGLRSLAEMGGEAAKVYAGAKLAAVTCPVVGAAPLSARTTYLYQKVGPAGEHLKFGITSAIPPRARYRAAQYAGGQMRILASGTRAQMAVLERALHRTLPLGPEERQIWYRVYQWLKGLDPFPY